jgi:hypothetical protein
VTAARVATAAALALFWALVLVGGSVEPGYSQVEDYVSRLASFGARVPALGVAAIGALALAHAAAADVLRRGRARVAAAALAVAAGAGAVVAAFRIHCTGGAAGCSAPPPAADAWTDAVHGTAVGVYEVALLVAMGALAVHAALRRRAVAAAASLAAALASAWAFARVDEPMAGADQRLWLAVSTVWLLAVAAGLAQLGPHRTPGR